MKERLLKIEEMAKLLGITARHLRNYQKDRLVPYLKINRVIRFDPDKVFAALQKFERKAL